MQVDQVKSASRAITMLDLFGRVRHPLTMSEIAAALGYPLSSTTVLLKTLIRSGHLSFNRQDRRYFPTPKVTALGDWIPQALFGSGHVLAAMRELHGVTGETTSLNTANDVQMQYLQIIQSTHSVQFPVDEGTLRPLTHSAVGWLLMSTMSDDRIDTVVRRANIGITDPLGRRTVPEIMAHIRTIRREGFGYAENVPFPGGATLCTLLPVTLQGRPVALGIGGALERVRQNHDRYLAALLQVARAVPEAAPGA